MLHTSVEIVNPGGTGRPAFVISARPEPLPPSRSFMFRLPSALPLPKKYTCFRDLGFGIRDLDAARFAAAFFAIDDSVDRIVRIGKPFRAASLLRARSQIYRHPSGAPCRVTLRATPIGPPVTMDRRPSRAHRQKTCPRAHAGRRADSWPRETVRVRAQA